MTWPGCHKQVVTWPGCHKAVSGGCPGVSVGALRTQWDTLQAAVRCAADPGRAGAAAAKASNTADLVDMAGSFAVGPALRMTPSRRASVATS